MSTVPSIELSRLQLPDLSGKPASDRLIDENSPALVRAFIQTVARREQVIRDEINEVANSVLLATASGRDLDQVAALYGIKRLQVTPADPDASPPTVAVMEIDERLRLRTRLSLEAMSQSGCEGAYLFHALSASAHIKDISVFNEDLKPEKINMVVLSDRGRGDGQAEEEEEIEAAEDVEMLKRVRNAMKVASSVTDEVSVSWAKIVEFSVNAELQIQTGQDVDEIYRSVKQKVKDLLHSSHRLGKNILRNEFFAVMYQPGVESVLLREPAKDIAVGIDCAPFNNADEEDENKFRIIVNRMPDVSFVFELPDFYQMAIRSSNIIRFTASMSGDKQG